MNELRSIQFETTTGCNAACRFCTHPDMKRSGRMTETLFRSIVQQGIALGVKHYYPFFLNEPLVDIRLEGWMRYLDECGGEFSLFTNAQLLDEHQAVWLLGSRNLRDVWISFYGATKEVYERAMRGLNFDISYRNVKRFIELYEGLDERGIEVPDRLLIRMSEYEDTAGQVEAFKALFGKYAIVNPHVNWAGDRPSAFARMDLPQHPCPRIMHQMYITFDGRVVLCCLDGHARVVLGDANTEPLADIWKRAQGIRDAHNRNDFDFYLCRTCSLNRS